MNLSDNRKDMKRYFLIKWDVKCSIELINGDDVGFVCFSFIVRF